MGKRPYIDFQEVKRKCPIPEVLEKLGIADKFTRKGDVLTGICPLPDHQHGPQPNTEQFKIDRRTGEWLWHCFGDCQRGGDVIELVKAVEGLDDAHVRFWFAEAFGDRLTSKRPKDTQKEEGEKITERKPLKPLRFYLDLDFDAAVPYLASRGISEKAMMRYGLGICRKGVLEGYIAIPVFRWPKVEKKENPVGYVGRWPGDDFDADAGRPRYKVPSDFETSRVVFGLPQALAAGNESLPLLVVEGPLKAMWLYEQGYPNVASSFTASISDEQADIMIKTGRPIILAFDGNEAGYTGMRTAAARLVTRTFLRVVKLPEGKEPDELSVKELEHYFGFAKPQE